eukprot:44232-Eustigmatos_ZCMA.PRE.1
MQLTVDFIFSSSTAEQNIPWCIRLILIPCTHYLVTQGRPGTQPPIPRLLRATTHYPVTQDRHRPHPAHHPYDNAACKPLRASVISFSSTAARQ